jgi:hypothetical protein
METVEESNNDFSTVPTGLGKPFTEGAPGFPQFPQPLLLDQNNN